MVILLKIKAFNTEEICVWFFTFWNVLLLMMISTHCDTNMDGMSGLVLQLITAPVICVSLGFFTCKLHLRNAFVLSAFDIYLYIYNIYLNFWVGKNHIRFYRWEFWDIEVSWLAKIMPIFRGLEFKSSTVLTSEDYSLLTIFTTVGENTGW